MKTWQAEMVVAAIVVGGITLAGGPGYVELVGAVAVLLTFGHAQVAERLAERDAARQKPSTSCHRWAGRYLIGKECLWLIYFILHRSYAALGGVIVFLLYPAWRAWWRERYPLREEVDPNRF